MVNINWKDKIDITGGFENLKTTYKMGFETLNIFPDLSSWQSGEKQSKDPWKNKLFWGENLDVLYFLLNDFEEKIDLIYIDPPFCSGVNYEINIEENGNVYNTIAYLDHWNNDLDSYLQMLYERLILFKKLLSKKGLIFIHLDWHASHYIKLIMDEIFGQSNFINNIVWYYYNKYSAGKKNLPRAHDDILVYSKSNTFIFNELRIPRKKPRKQLKREMVNGVLKNAKDENGHVIYRVVTDKKMDDVWKIPCMQPASKEWTGFPTQKHHELLERIIKIGSNEGDLIADFFCGSGTTLLTAEKLNRRWMGCDISEYSIYISCKRLLNLRKQTLGDEVEPVPIEILTNLNEKRKKIIDDGFFEKNLEIKRKK